LLKTKRLMPRLKILTIADRRPSSVARCASSLPAAKIPRYWNSQVVAAMSVKNSTSVSTSA